MQARFGGDKSHILEGLDHPGIDFVLEFVEIDILFLHLVALTVDVDHISGKHRCELDIQTLLADGQRHLFGTEEHLGLLLFLVDTDCRHPRGAERTLYEQRGLDV